MQEIKRDQVIYAFENEMNEIATVKDGETFLVNTCDCFQQQITQETQVLEKINHETLNPATGPIFVEGAEIGDILKVDILDIEVEDQGVSAAIPNGGALGDLVEKPIIKIIKIENQEALFNDLKIPIKPMIGVIGVATKKENGSIPTNSPHKHGGNMDTKEITKGTSLYFPVAQKGALLALGDLHAVMGDGELCFTGLEIPGKVTLRVEVIKSKELEWPLLETEKETMVIASEKTLEEAVHSSSKLATEILAKNLGLSFEEAYLLASLTLDAKISQLVNPLVTVRASIPKYILQTSAIIKNL